VSALNNDFVNWKDDELIQQLSGEGTHRALTVAQHEYSPVQYQWFRFEYRVGGDRPFLYRAVSILLHTTNAILFFLLVSALLRSRTVAFGSSLIVAIHPTQIGTIALLHQQESLLSFLSVLIFLSCYLYCLRHDKRHTYILLLCAFLLVLAVSGPVLYPLLAMIVVYRVEKGRIPSVKEQTPFWGLWLLSLLVDTIIQKQIGDLILYVDKNVTMLRLGIIEGMIKFVSPFSLSVLRHWILYSSHSSYYSGLVFPFLIAGITAVLVIHRNRFPIVLIGWLLYVSMRLPFSSGAFPIDVYVFDSSMYSSISLLSIFVFSMVVWCGRRIVSRWHNAVLNYAILGMAVFALSLFSFWNIAFWKNSQTLWTQALHEDPENVFSLNRRGSYYYRRHHVDKALEDFREALRIEPRDIQSNMNMGLAYLMAQNLDSAIIRFKTILGFEPANYMSFYNLATVYNEYNKLDSAAISYTSAIQYCPEFIQAYNGRAIVFAKTGHYADALADDNKAIAIDPQYADAWENRALLFMQTGHPEKAILDFQKECALAPKRIDVRIQTGLSAVMIGSTEIAKRNFLLAKQIDSTASLMYFNSMSRLFLLTPAQMEAAEDCFRYSSDTVNEQ
jgi:tetratricopeptide (TPR) repeat protein